MDPSDAAAEIAVLQVIATIGWATAMAAAILIAFLGRLTDRGCAHCEHCQRKNADDDERGRDRMLKYLGLLPMGSHANKQGDTERERRFGHSVVGVDEAEEAPPEEGPPDDPDGGDPVEAER